MGQPGIWHIPLLGIVPVPTEMPFDWATFFSECAGSLYPRLPGTKWSVDAASEREKCEVSKTQQPSHVVELAMWA